MAFQVAPAITHADGVHIEKAARRLLKEFKNSRWLDPANRYNLDCAGQVKSDLGTGAIDPTSLTEYIAASAPIHSVDAWAYVGRALTAASHGDVHAARHLAYYAELRAALSILATEGFGIFNDHHVVVDATGNLHQIVGWKRKQIGTHAIAWNLLRGWADTPKGAGLLGEAIVAGGTTLADWVTIFQPTASLVPVSSHWLGAWGLDLARLSGDRDARNASSYRPTSIPSTHHIDPKGFVEHVVGMWSVSEPQNPSFFEPLDRHLVRLTLEMLFRGVTGKQPPDPGYAADVKRTVTTLGPSGMDPASWEAFLTRSAVASDPAVLVQAGANAPPTDPTYYLQVVSRAYVLARLATGASLRLCGRAGITGSDLVFWSDHLGEIRGLWGPGAKPNPLTDLWADVDVAISEAKTWHGKGKNTTDDLWRQVSPSMSSLGKFERIGLWSLSS